MTANESISSAIYNRLIERGLPVRAVMVQDNPSLMQKECCVRLMSLAGEPARETTAIVPNPNHHGGAEYGERFRQFIDRLVSQLGVNQSPTPAEEMAEAKAIVDQRWDDVGPLNWTLKNK